MDQRTLIIATLWVGWVNCLGVFAQDETAEARAFFEKQIRPVLIKECYSCHSAEGEDIEGGLTLDTRAGSRRGGARGSAVVPGKINQSLLITALEHTDDDFRMPPDKKLSAEVIADFKTWIERGAFDPREGEARIVDKYQIDPVKVRDHWAFQLPQQPTLPVIEDSRWSQTEVDMFILAGLESRGLQPVADTDRRTLLRRLSFDLIGLPPTPEQMEAFAGAEPTETWTQAVDRLLDSPHFGEKWARHWMDVARFAESTGKTVNFYYPQAWRYRDYLIAAFNADKPYNEFIREQLAGDLIPGENPDITAERMIATGFLALGPKTLNERSGLKYELDVVDEQIDVMSRAFLGMTVACSRCHDHMFDPIPQTDYYALAGIFRSTETHYGTVRYINAQRATPLLTLPDDAQLAAGKEPLGTRERRQIESQIERVKESMRESRDGLQRFFSSGRLALLEAQLDAYNDEGEPKRTAMGVTDKPRPSARGSRFSRGPRRFGDYTYDGMRSIGDSPLFIRGEHDQPTDETVPRGALQVMTETPLDISPGASGRLELANLIASPQNSLTARVMVNRIWLQLFGRGLVPTADDFGLAGLPPSHPELLDFLAVKFMSDGWSVKKMIRYLVMSRVYQLSTVSQPQAIQVDPSNTYYWRMQPRRLEAEILRDAMLAVSGQLQTDPPIGSDVARAGEGPVSGFGSRSVLRSLNDPRNTHRSVYLPVIRDNLPEALGLFDAADPSLITASRDHTTVPSQGLYLLNNELVMRAADAAAANLLELESDDLRIQDAFLRFYGRSPNEAEQAASVNFLSRYRQQLALDEVSKSRQTRESWTAFCQALFASAEFQYRR